jgi:hypothetical protein
MELESSLFPLGKQELLDHHMEVVNLFSGFGISIWQSTQSTHQLNHFVTLKSITQEFEVPVNLKIFGPTDGSQIYAHQNCLQMEKLKDVAFQIGFSNGLHSLRFGKKSENSKTRRKKFNGFV